jgi:hypothetical protein
MGFKHNTRLVGAKRWERLNVYPLPPRARLAWVVDDMMRYVVDPNPVLYRRYQKLQYQACQLGRDIKPGSPLQPLLRQISSCIRASFPSVYSSASRILEAHRT